MPSHMDVRSAVSLRRRSPVEVFLDIGAIVLLRGHNCAAPIRVGMLILFPARPI